MYEGEVEKPVPQAENVDNPSIDNSEKNGIIETEVKQEMNLVIDKFTPCLEDIVLSKTPYKAIKSKIRA